MVTNIGKRKQNRIRKQKKGGKRKRKQDHSHVHNVPNTEDIVDNAEYEVECILDHRVIHPTLSCHYSQIEYHVRYKGYTDNFNEWTTAAMLNNNLMVLNYWKNQAIDYATVTFPDMQKLYRLVREISIPHTSVVYSDQLYLGDRLKVVLQYIDVDPLLDMDFATANSQFAIENYQHEYTIMMDAVSGMGLSSNHMYSVKVMVPYGEDRPLNVENVDPISGKLFKWRYELEIHREALLQLHIHKCAWNQWDKLNGIETSRELLPSTTTVGDISDRHSTQLEPVLLQLSREESGWKAAVAANYNTWDGNRLRLREIKYPPGTKICHLGGELVKVEEARRLYRLLGEYSRRFFVQLPERFDKWRSYCIDRRRYRDISYYCCHSCEPNCRLIWKLIDHTSPLFGLTSFPWVGEIVTMKEVGSNERLTIDWYKDNGNICTHEDVVHSLNSKDDIVRCFCGSPKCRQILFKESSYSSGCTNNERERNKWANLKREERLKKLDLSSYNGSVLDG